MTSLQKGGRRISFSDTAGQPSATATAATTSTKTPSGAAAALSRPLRSSLSSSKSGKRPRPKKQSVSFAPKPAFAAAATSEAPRAPSAGSGSSGSPLLGDGARSKTSIVSDPDQADADKDTTTAAMTHNFFSPNLGEQGSIRMRSRAERTRTARATGLTASGGTVSNPDFADTLRRVSVVVQQHIVRGERLKRRYEATRAQRAADRARGDFGGDVGGGRGGGGGGGGGGQRWGLGQYGGVADMYRSPESAPAFSAEGAVGLDERRRAQHGVVMQLTEGKTSGPGSGGSSSSSRMAGGANPSLNAAANMPVGERLAASANFHEDLFVKPTWEYTFVRPPAGLFLTTYQMVKVQREYKTPDVSEIHAFINNLFMKGQVRKRNNTMWTEKKRAVSPSLSHPSPTPPYPALPRPPRPARNMRKSTHNS